MPSLPPYYKQKYPRRVVKAGQVPFLILIKSRFKTSSLLIFSHERKLSTGLKIEQECQAIQ
jgi:hypothetical protein